ncbi:MAG: hypothetical protein KKF85_09035, partial [Gammaproteobacteria bacterium]|nr:hypothetical protein [Rhodocyclaceae bacterium]MBU3908175.1 hypothetical protein [Gammaproteobacteria bacterium]MBU4003751.1 hypothetical protein [Gammaproteobacteria bacterium]MBU4096839.1 hypothetical protein [Gammaproteobacteria bacterium]MBU4147096.1 hypothetical protein [Gammaproteobacteria bacterium]
MATTLEYALMAGVAYRSTRNEINRFPIPTSSGWNELSGTHRSLDDTGFEAISFTNGTEIVISYAGTYNNPPITFFNPDRQASVGLALGMGSAQLLQAAEYYLQVKAAHTINGVAPQITLTGHSLGGGLAALIAVMFGEEATTFDQAPFRASALSAQTDEYGNPVGSSVAENLHAYLSDHATTEQLAKLDTYIAANDPRNTSPNIADTLTGREAAVSNHNVQGEFLSGVPWNWLDRIGTTIEDIPTSADGVAGDDLHSQALLTAYLQSRQTADANQTLNAVTFKLPDLLKMIFDKKLFAFDTDKSDENLLERLVKHEAGITGSLPADAMLTRFTADLWKLAQDGGLTLNDGVTGYPDLNDMSKALTAFAMQFYYEDTANATDDNKQLFT